MQVDGMDVLAVKAASAYARDWALSGKGPLVLEFNTYRYQGHSMSDPGTSYRTRDEVQEMRSTKDPIVGLRQHILDTNTATEETLKVRALRLVRRH